VADVDHLARGVKVQVAPELGKDVAHSRPVALRGAASGVKPVYGHISAPRTMAVTPKTAASPCQQFFSSGCPNQDIG
jgi:hypothetical protein